MTGDDPEYQYHLKDHLGNVRVTFTTKEDIEENIATLETANAATEQSQFLYYDEAVKINSTLFDHTNNGATQYSTRLSGSPNEQTGLAKSISVMPGDTIRTEVYAKYLDGNTSNWTTALTDLMAAIANGTAPAGTFVDGGATGSTGGTTPPFLGLLDKGDETGNAPKAYLNYLIFDKNYVLLNGGFVRMSENAREYGQDGAHEKLAAEFVITEPGYVYIYLSNDNAALGGSTVEVYFDDFRVVHQKSPVIASNDYYPFGMIAERTSREGMTEQSFLYNGMEIQDELDLGWYDYFARQYDPAIGRFLSIDPLADISRRWSPYVYVYNNPVRFIDPDGMFPQDCLKCQERTRTEQTITNIQIQANTDSDGNITSLDVSFTLTNRTTTELVNMDENSSEYGQVVSAHTESVTSNERATFGAAEGSGTVDKQTGMLMAPLNEIIMPGGNTGLKITSDAKIEKGSLGVNVSPAAKVSTEKSKLTKASVDQIVAARTEFFDASNPSVMQKYIDYVLPEPKDRKNKLNAVSGDHEGRRQRQDNQQRVKRHKLDSLKKLHGN